MSYDEQLRTALMDRLGKTLAEANAIIAEANYVRPIPKGMTVTIPTADGDRVVPYEEYVRWSPDDLARAYGEVTDDG